MNYTTILSKLSHKEFQIKKKEYNISLGLLDIKEVSHLLNGVQDKDFVTSEDFIGVSTIIDCLKYLSKSSLVYQSAKNSLMEQSVEECSFLDSEIQYLSKEHPDIIEKYKNKYIKNMYLEKENYQLWKDLQHEEILERINSGMLDHVLLDESNKAYMQNLKSEDNAYKFNYEKITPHTNSFKNVYKWFPDTNINLYNAITLIENDRATYLYLPSHIQSSKEVLEKIFNNKICSYDACGDSLENDPKNWSLADFENHILHNVSNEQKILEIAKALLDYDAEFSKSRYLKSCAKNNVELQLLLQEFNQKHASKVFKLDNIPNTIEYQNLKLQTPQVLEKYFFATSDENKSLVFPFILDHFSFSALSYNYNLDEHKEFIAKSCLSLIMNYQYSSNENLRNLISFSRKSLSNHDDYVLALVKLNNQLDTCHQIDALELLHREILSFSNVDVQLKFVENRYKNIGDINHQIQDLIASYTTKSHKKVKP